MSRKCLLDCSANGAKWADVTQKETSNAANPNMRLVNAEIGKRDGSQAYFFQLAIQVS